MNRIETLAWAILLYEGYTPGSRSWRNSNPGNLKMPGTAGLRDKEGFATFQTFIDGWEALVYDLFRKYNGRNTHGLNQDSTLLQMLDIFAPKADGNETEKYSAHIANIFALAGDKTVSDSTKLSYFFTT
jgi:hypothetical protein